MKSTVPLVDHLLGYKLRFKLSRSNFDSYTQLHNNTTSEGAKIMIDLKNKFKAKKRAGDKVQTEDGKITIELF